MPLRASARPPQGSPPINRKASFFSALVGMCMVKKDLRANRRDYYIESCFLPSSKFKTVVNIFFNENITAAHNRMKLLINAVVSVI
jgi:hypothetical protein